MKFKNGVQVSKALEKKISTQKFNIQKHLVAPQGNKYFKYDATMLEPLVLLYIYKLFEIHQEGPLC